MTELGCADCYGEDAEAALAYHRGRVTPTHRVIDDSHFLVSVRTCPACGQRFVQIFTEFVDWSGGNDAQYLDIVPVTPEEADRVVAAGERVDLAELGALGTGRRHLVSDWPSSGPKRISWQTGPFTVQEGH